MKSNKQIKNPKQHIGTGIVLLFCLGILSISCKKETRDKIAETTNDVKNVSSVVSNVQSLQEKAAKLRELTPLTNDELKAWLPESLRKMERKSYRVGKAGYTNISSIMGTYANTSAESNETFKVEVIDGAGEMGSMVMMSMGMVGNMEVEEEDEHKHLQTVEKKGFKARQLYYKKRNNTEVQFVYDDRFAIKVNATNMDVDKTWALLDDLNLKKLSR